MPKVILKIEIDELARAALLDLAKRLNYDPSDLVRTLVYSKKYELRMADEARKAKPAAQVPAAKPRGTRLGYSAITKKYVIL